MRFLPIVLLNLLAVCAFAAPNRAELNKQFGNIPLHFEESSGQAGPKAGFTTRAPGYSAFITNQGAELSFGAARLRLSIPGARHAGLPEPLGPLPSLSNYYVGKDPAQWKVGVRHYERVRVPGIRTGIDLVYHGSQKQLEFDFEVAPHADAHNLRLRYAGARSLSLDDGGNLVIHTEAGDLTQHKPVAWQGVGSEKKAVEASYGLRTNHEVAIEVGDYDPRLPLTIDPVLSYSTYLSGSQNDVVTSIAVDAFGYAYVAGYTSSPDFPVTTGRFHGYTDAFVTKLNPSGTAIVYSTVFGGTYDDKANAIALDGAGNAYVTGQTLSTDYPAVGTGLTSAVAEAILTKIGPTGALIFSRTFGNGGANGQSIAVDSSGSSYITGTVYTFGLATPGAFQSQAPERFVAKLGPAAAIVYATYLGANYASRPSAIAVDASGNTYITGSTTSNFPVTPGALQTTFRGQADAFVVKLNPSGSALVYSTFLGGTGDDAGLAIAVDAAGNAYVGGRTTSNDFPSVSGAFSSGSYNLQGFVAKLNPAGSALVFSTSVGAGSFNDAVSGLAVDAAGTTFLTGLTSSNAFPTTPGALENQSAPAPSGLLQQNYFAILNPSGGALTYSTYLGLAGALPVIAIDSAGGAYIAGSTPSSAFPATPSAYETTFAPKSPFSNFVSSWVGKIDTSSPTTCNIIVPHSPAPVSAHGVTGSFSFTLGAGCPWQITSDSWITISGPTSGIGSATVTYSVTANDSTFLMRVGGITFQSGLPYPGSSALYQIVQGKASCVDPLFTTSSLSFDPNGGIVSVGITLPTNCAWNPTFTLPWLTVTSGVNGQGNGTLSLFAPKNSFAPRQGSITVAGKPISVAQGGGNCTAALLAPSANFGSGGGTGAAPFSLSSSTCVWTAFTDASWIGLDPSSSSGTGSGTVAFKLASNYGYIARVGHILIGDQTFQVVQAPGSTFPDNPGYVLRFVADQSRVPSPGYLFADLSGGVYVSESTSSRVLLFDGTGGLTVIAGGGSANPGDGGQAILASLGHPAGIALDAAGNVYFADSLQSRIRKVARNGVISTYAGTGVAGYNGDGAAATTLQLNGPSGIVFDSAGNLFIGDTNNQRIRKVAVDGTMTTVAGTGTAGFSGDGGPAASAVVNAPGSLSIDGAGNLYIQDSGNFRVRKISPAGVISTVAGNGTQITPPELSAATTTGLENFSALTVDQRGVIYFGSAGRIYKVGLDGLIRTVLTTGTQPTGLYADAFGSVLESQAGIVWKLMPQEPFCSYTVSQPPIQTSSGGPLSLTVTTATGCSWSALPASPWITYTASTATTANFTIGANTTGATRTGNIAIAGQTIALTQNASVLSPSTFVTALYQDLLNRTPDAGGLAYYVNALNSGGLTKSQEAAQFFTSPEFSNAGLYIIKLYFAILKRNPDFGGWKYWFDAMNSGQSSANVLNGFLSSSEFQQLYGTVDNAAFVTLAYQNVLGRAPDPSGYNYWFGLLNGGSITRAFMMDQFVRSPEYDNAVRARAYANLLYMGFLRRAADAGGLAFWTNVLGDPANLPEAIRGFIESPEYLGRF